MKKHINWDFIGNKPTLLDAIHPYPAKFIREIPQNLLDVYQPDKDSIIFDPFCGSGTTLSVAQEMGYRVLGVDINPIACLISTVKTQYVDTSGFDINYFMASAARNLDYGSTIDIKNVGHWFMPHVISEILSLLVTISELCDDAIKNMLKLTLSSIIVKVSNQDSDTRYAAIKKDIKKGDVYSLFTAAYKKTRQALFSRRNELPLSIVQTGNALNFNDSAFYGKVGMLITSPPYPNAYEYWLYHKYRMYWLGFDPESVKKEEIGARAHFFKKKCATEDTFKEQMNILFGNIKKYMRKDAIACFVIGRSIIHGKAIDNAAILEEAARLHGFKVIDQIERNIRNSHKSFNLSHANIKTEKIIILENGN